ncbi:hypothetical protein NAL32_16835 [Chryseobacterium sp. Ch-15]|uniref:Uncharacterized protein n=1 Tax=Chryseobacterium muglaense TaxID=2893752 RepID=A0A9Q3UT97_9FLAO|nr:hypothetical protein [Chryseobacterium muglaense]MBD3906353.1 hypothetical protein [Chryseobacterium muglaense]MCC9033618.1 hypothetical protein [Chryseobacterium muglaense]MCM2556052.1 hypothetical protein [Chryseobacterium muglaense]
MILILILSLITSCISRKNTQYVLNGNYVLTKAKFFKIETKNGIHIFHFKNDSIEGVFTKVVDTSFANENYRKIKLNKKYTLYLQKQVYANLRTQVQDTQIIENNIVVWKDEMKSQHFVDCENITGNQINPRFTLLKYINPNPVKY